MVSKYKEKPEKSKRIAHNKKTHEEYIEELKIKNPEVVPQEQYIDVAPLSA